MAQRTCSVDDCTAQSHARGMCNKHYLRTWSKGCFPAKSIEDRFWEKVDKSADTGCWIWTGAGNGHGYGVFHIGQRKHLYAHRYSYQLATGVLPEFVDHTCHQRSCVNPRHLRPVTVKQNNENRSVVNAKSGIRGVRLTESGRYQARVRHNGRDYSGGTFATVEEAETVVVELRNKLFTHNNLDRLEV